jgi:hypothetical protein
MRFGLCRALASRLTTLNTRPLFVAPPAPALAGASALRRGSGGDFCCFSYGSSGGFCCIGGGSGGGFGSSGTALAGASALRRRL